MNITWDEERYESNSSLVPPYTLKPRSTSLPSRARAEAAEKGSGQPATLQFRDITEDDDGYHPYADVPDMRPLFEPNPWD